MFRFEKTRKCPSNWSNRKTTTEETVFQRPSTETLRDNVVYPFPTKVWTICLIFMYKTKFNIVQDVTVKLNRQQCSNDDRRRVKLIFSRCCRIFSDRTKIKTNLLKSKDKYRSFSSRWSFSKYQTNKTTCFSFSYRGLRRTSGLSFEQNFSFSLLVRILTLTFVYF